MGRGEYEEIRDILMSKERFTGGISSLTKSPLPQLEVPGKVTPVRVVGGFFETLPPSVLMFFNRTFMSRVPAVIQFGAGASPFPRQVQIVSFQVPARQVFVVRDVVFTGYQRSGIDPQDVTPVDPKRLVNFATYTFLVADRAPTDFATNVGGTATPSAVTEFIPITGNNTFPTNAYPFGGSIRDAYPNFATYARPGQRILLAYTILQPFRIDIRQFSAEISGYIMEEVKFDKLLGGVVGQ